MTASGRFSRRDFLKLSSSAALGLFSSTLSLPGVQAAGARSILQPPPTALGRVAYNKVRVYDIPDTGGNQLTEYKLDEVFPLAGQVTGLDPSAYNPTWYQLENGGYVYSGGIQPVNNVLNTPVTDIPKEGPGLLAELTVPFTDARWKVTKESLRRYRLYYGTTYWVKAVQEDFEKNLWYRIYDDLFQLTYYVRAEHMRMIPPEEVSPISPDVPDDHKMILVSLPEQVLVAYEDLRPVFTAKISSGTGKGERSRSSTPTGGFFTFFKRAAGHMAGGDGISSFYDLPGVPWASYINVHGVSIHGTYWHNDFGKPHSHGCINLPSDQAKWIFRWSTPQVPDGKRFIYKPGIGTQVYVSEQPLFELPAPPLYRHAG
jgi:lipoprotein-anchoring transpeptidase ErfK/SrfK